VSALVVRGAPGFREAAVGPMFNARRPAREPAAVLRARSEQDVVDGLALATERGWQIAVRSGGHSWAGWSVRDDVLLIDLGAMHDMAFDPDTGVAAARPAVRGGQELAPFLEGHRRMFTGGHCASVGLGGFLLQAGQGWNSRRWGWGCENVVGLDVVTAGGELVHASADENADLFWAARGSGPGFFGVVTRFHVRTHPLTPMFHDTRVFALGDLEPLLGWLHEVLPTLDVAVEPVVAATRLRGAGPELLLHTTLTAGSAEEAAELLAPLDACPAAAVEHERGPTTMADENAAQALQNPERHRYCADSQWTNAGADELVPRLRSLYAELPTEHSFSIWYGWAPQRALPDMAFSLEANVYLATYAIWAEAADDERNRNWVHGHHAGLAEIGEGVYLGDSDLARRPDRFMADENFRRLQEIRDRRDPEDRFVTFLAADGSRLNEKAGSA
jgi:FAD/FMN-containing dehydrogenase